MRWLTVQPGPSFSVADVHNGWVEALRSLGQEVADYNLDRRLTFYDQALLADDINDDQGRQAVHRAFNREQAVTLAAQPILSEAMMKWPHVVLFTSAFFIPHLILEVLRSRGMKIVMLFTESPYQDGMQLDMARYADVALVNDPVNLDRFREVAPQAVYMPHAYRPQVHYPASSPDREWDMAFVGTGFPSRIKFFGEMDLSGLKVKMAGPWEDPQEWADFDHEDCISNTQTADIYRSSRTGINFYRRESEDDHAGEGWAMGPREVEMAACGLWFARDPRPESDGLFPMLPAFSSPLEASDAIRWALKHEDAREKAATAARRAVAGRTFENHARKLLALLDS